MAQSAYRSRTPAQAGERVPAALSAQRHDRLEQRPAARMQREQSRLLNGRNRTGLPDGLRAGIEVLSGVSLDGVRVHRNSPEPARLHALAYAQGTDIHLAPGQEEHLPHEAWHVVQQAQGRVRPTAQMKGGTALNNDSALEREADAMGRRALQMRAAPSQAGPSHDPQCGCGCCAPAPAPAPAGPRPIQGRTISPAPIQRCVHCGDNRCIKGERCGYDRSQGGLFDAATAASAPAVLPYNSSNAKKQSGKAVGRELEHPIPGAALRQMGQGAGYRTEYVVPIDKTVHRAAVDGAGGGITSTGSSHTARGWATEIANQPTDFDVVRMSVVDEINAHLKPAGPNNRLVLDKTVALTLSDWLVSQFYQTGRITAQQLAELQSLVINKQFG